jgi:hypothetical protein
MGIPNENSDGKLGRGESLPNDPGRIRKAEQWGELLTSLPKWVALAIIAWQAALSIQALAGQGSFASFLMRFGRETSLWELVCWAAGLAGILLALYTGHLLRRQTTWESARIETLEKRLDAGRGGALSANNASIREKQ